MKETNPTTGIYKIQSKIKPERYYIGSGIDINRRWRLHKSHLFKNEHHSPTLQRHVNKYGFEDLVFTVVEECIKEELIVHEQKHLDADFPYFNNCRIAESMLGYKHTEETRRKVSKARTGTKRPPISEEHKQKISESNRKRKRSEKSKRKTSETMKGKKFSEKHRRNVIAANKRRKIDTT